MIPFISAIIPVVGKVLDKIIPDVVEREKVKMEIQLKLAEQEGELVKALIQSDLAQAEINKLDAQSNDKFKSYWRPALAWVCVLSFTWLTVIQPIVVFFHSLIYKAILPLPAFDTSILTTVLFGILGLAGYRTYEKKTGITK